MPNRLTGSARKPGRIHRRPPQTEAGLTGSHPWLAPAMTRGNTTAPQSCPASGENHAVTRKEQVMSRLTRTPLAILAVGLLATAHPALAQSVRLDCEVKQYGKYAHGEAREVAES